MFIRFDVIHERDMQMDRRTLRDSRRSLMHRIARGKNRQIQSNTLKYDRLDDEMRLTSRPQIFGRGGGPRPGTS